MEAPVEHKFTGLVIDTFPELYCCTCGKQHTLEEMRSLTGFEGWA